MSEVAIVLRMIADDGSCEARYGSVLRDAAEIIEQHEAEEVRLRAALAEAERERDEALEKWRIGGTMVERDEAALAAARKVIEPFAEIAKWYARPSQR